MPFRDLIGHGRLLAIISRSAHHDSLPPSALFAGPPGVGKRRVAVALAQALNCTSPTRGDGFDLDACGRCAACQRIERLVHPDVLVIEPGDSGTIKIDQVRDVIERAGYRPFEGRRRVVIFDEADALVPAAQNALLKTLEEPPPASIFLLITARPDALLPTVRSRCPVLRFGPLSEDEVAQALIAAGKSGAEARALASTADGSVGRALASDAEDVLDARRVAFDVLIKAASQADPRRRLEVAKVLLEGTGAGGASDRGLLLTHLRAMSTLLRDVALVSTRVTAVAPANADLGADLERLRAYSGDRGLRAFGAVDEAMAALDRNAGTKIVADWIALRL